MASRKKTKKKKQPAFSLPPAPEKRPGWVGPLTLEGRHLSWRFSAADKGGKWAWSKAVGNTLKEIMAKLAEFEKLDYASGLRTICHPIQTISLSRPAKQRLLELQRDDIETLHSWRIGAKERLWCADYQGMMCVLWWDTDHEVYLVRKKNT